MNDLAESEEVVERVRAVLMFAVVPLLAAWLESRRWFADKGRGIAGIEIEDALVEPVDDDWLALAVVRVAFREGEAERYFVPLAWTVETAGSDTIAAAMSGAIVDATSRPWFGGWMVAALSGDRDRTPGNWLFTAPNTAKGILAAARQTPATLMRAEQSNTSLRFGDAIMLKLVRRLQAGPNPDEEISRALADIGFQRAPPYAGAASWRGPDGTSYPIALAQQFVPNLGDGWSWMLQRLLDLDRNGTIAGLNRDSPEWRLGLRTGELHVALANIDDPDFAPELVDGVDVATEQERVTAAVDRTISLLEEESTRLPDWARANFPAIVGGLHDATARAEGFLGEAGTRRIRVHGDFHLGQTLRTPDDDWVIIDFEGEPARPVPERRQKTSALKDVAGMLRSFAYARGAVERAMDDPVIRDVRQTMAAWERHARTAFLSGYREAIAQAPAPLVADDDAAFLSALAVWELDKALYEIAYEARNRPDWLELPLRSLLPEIAS